MKEQLNVAVPADVRARVRAAYRYKSSARVLHPSPSRSDQCGKTSRSYAGDVASGATTSCATTELIDTGTVVVESAAPPGCPVCGVISVRVHSRRWQVVRDVPVGGPVEVVWGKRRWFCQEARCPRGTFAESTVQVPPRARSTSRLREALVAVVVVSGRVASETARAFAVSWWSVQAALSAVAVLLGDVNGVAVCRLGVDEHRYRSVKYFRRPDGTWARFEPWMTTLVDLDTGQVLGVVDGRDSAGVGAWLAARTPTWRQRREDRSANTLSRPRSPRTAKSPFDTGVRAQTDVTDVRQLLDCPNCVPLR